jgi:1,4-alpha-glucan branching enzyme
MDQSIIDLLVGGQHADPFAVLGLHRSDKKVPGAVAIDAIARTNGDKVCSLTKIHDQGLFEGIFVDNGTADYQLQVQYPLATMKLDDPYRYGSLINAQDLHLFHEGSHENAHHFLGSHVKVVGDTEGVLFAVWAPNAGRVAVVGEFNNWDTRTHPMRHHVNSGIWELFVPGVKTGAHYKYAINKPGGEALPLKSDPYARAMELRPGTASKVTSADAFRWQDDKWMNSRKHCHSSDAPISIYEVHLGSWRRENSDGNYPNYRALAQELIPYVKSLGFTHIQLMPIYEHPFGGSWGYQPIGMFAPTSRFGDHHDFSYFVDFAHQMDIGVLLDWVPGHFPTDEHGLGEFDGTHLYEHSDSRQGFHPDWNTYIFNYGRPEVISYLLSNALYWLAEFHIDGLRFDAVASMLYLDYSRDDDQWIPNTHGGRENLEAVEFLKLVNTRAYGHFPDILMIAEESTSWSGVTHKVDNGGLGFGFKWNLGWMNDTLKYMSRDPIHRQYHTQEITFGLLYAFSEKFILPLSHDEVVHGKKSLIEKMPGDNWQKFANLRALYGLMWAHPGKKLLFMGNEIAQRKEWAHKQSLDWQALQSPDHKGVQSLVRDLNNFYVESAALWFREEDSATFEWIATGEHSGTIFIFIRRAWDANQQKTIEVIVACNLTPTYYEEFRFGVPNQGRYQERINTDKTCYAGSGQKNQGAIETQDIQSHGRPFSLSIALPPLATLYLTTE